MKPIIKNLETAPFRNPETFVPQDPDVFMFGINLYIGPEDGPGADHFALTVCSPKWFAENEGRVGIVDGRHHLFAAEYNWPAIKHYVESYVASCVGDTWMQVGEKIARLAQWEFEDYVEDEA